MFKLITDFLYVTNNQLILMVRCFCNLSLGLSPMSKFKMAVIEQSPKGRKNENKGWKTCELLNGEQVMNFVNFIRNFESIVLFPALTKSITTLRRHSCCGVS